MLWVFSPPPPVLLQHFLLYLVFLMLAFHGGTPFATSWDVFLSSQLLQGRYQTGMPLWTALSTPPSRPPVPNFNPISPWTSPPPPRRRLCFSFYTATLAKIIFTPLYNFQFIILNSIYFSPLSLYHLRARPLICFIYPGFFCIWCLIHFCFLDNSSILTLSIKFWLYPW